MNFYVFQVSDQSKDGKQRTAKETFDYLVRDHSVWGFGYHTPNRKAVQAGDKALFYLTGSDNQIFVGYATLKSGPYEDKTGESKTWWINPETLRIDLDDVQCFLEAKPRKQFKSIDWKPAQGGSSKISEHDFNIIVGLEPDIITKTLQEEDDTTFALERYLEDFMVTNFTKIDFGETLSLFEDRDGNIGQQYFTNEAGYIDILAKDTKGNYIVMELKKGRKNDEVIGQVLRYMGWVRRNLCKKGEDVRGIIIVGERDKKLEYAISEIGNKVSAKVYKISFKLENY